MPTSSYWVGISGVYNHGVYRRTDAGKAITWAAWDGGQPKGDLTFDCVYIAGDTGKMTEEQCSVQLGYICQTIVGEFIGIWHSIECQMASASIGH